MAEGDSAMVRVVALCFGLFGDFLHGIRAGHCLASRPKYGPEIRFVGLIDYVTRKRLSIYEHIDAMWVFLGAKAGVGRFSEGCAAKQGRKTDQWQ